MGSLVIEQRFMGPPGSGNGGYSCGLAATAFTDGPAEVTLRMPPPLHTDLEPTGSLDEGAEVRAGDRVVAGVRAWDGSLAVPDMPDSQALAAGMESFDLAAYAGPHPFPTCFTCGPGRGEGDGLRIFPAAVGPGSTVAWRWIPDALLDDGSGSVPVPVMWAALDCPGAHTWLGDEPAGIDTPVVLGRLAVEIHRPARVGEKCVVAGWQLDRDGRKLGSGTAVWSEGGELLGKGQATWVVLDAEQAAAFTSGGSSSGG
jgi:hypothetical protein